MGFPTVQCGGRLGTHTVGDVKGPRLKPRQLTMQLLKAGSAKRLSYLWTVARGQGCFNHIHFCLVFQQAARLGKTHTDESSSLRHLLEKVVQECHALVLEVSAKEASNVLWAAARLGVQLPVDVHCILVEKVKANRKRLYEEILALDTGPAALDLLEERLGEMNELHLGSVLVKLASLPQDSPLPQGVNVPGGEPSSPCHRERPDPIFAPVGDCQGYRMHRAISLALARCRKVYQHMRIKDVVAVMWACARLRYSLAPRDLTYLLKAARPTLLNPRSLAVVLWSLAVLVGIQGGPGGMDTEPGNGTPAAGKQVNMKAQEGSSIETQIASEVVSGEVKSQTCTSDTAACQTGLPPAGSCFAPPAAASQVVNASVEATAPGSPAWAMNPGDDEMGIHGQKAALPQEDPHVLPLGQQVANWVSQLLGPSHQGLLEELQTTPVRYSAMVVYGLARLRLRLELPTLQPLLKVLCA